MLQGAFVTGSQLFGAPNKKSDIDLVVRLTTSEALMLRGMSDDKGEDSSSSGGVPLQRGQMTMRFGSLNLIVCTRGAYFQAWIDATRKALGLPRPVSKNAAAVLFHELFKDRQFS